MPSTTGKLLVERRFPARASMLRRIRKTVGDALLKLACSEACVHDVVMAVDEACQNIIRHAYRGGNGDIVVSLRLDGDELSVHLVDFAPPVDPSRIRPRPLEELRPGGLGTHFIRSVMDDIAFLPPPPGAGNLLQMKKRISRS